MSASEKIDDKIDYSLLFFITGVTYVKLYIKIAAILFFAAYIIYKKYKFSKPVGLNKFYLIMPVIGTIGSLLHYSFSQKGYWFGWSFGVMYWLLAGVTSYLLYIGIINTNRQSLHKTIKAFFAVNFIASIAQLIYLMVLSRHIMPYWFWDSSEYFGSSTGDHIHGIFNSISVTNAMVSTLGCFYFLYRRDLFWSLLSMMVMLLCTSNLTLLIFIAISAILLILVRKRYVRVNVFLLLLITGLIYPFLSPQNIKYVDTVYEQETSKAPKKAVVTEKAQPLFAEKDKNELEEGFSKLDVSLEGPIKYYRLPLNDKKVYKHIDELKYMDLFGELENKEDNVAMLDTNTLKKTITNWYGVPYEKTPLVTYNKPIKLYANIQTLFYISEDPFRNFFGAGIGNFSSKQALKMLGINVQGSYPLEYAYVSEDFVRYHLYTFFYVFSLPISEHSIINMINSVYNQVGGEYGIAGILAFLLLYLGFFWKHRKNMSRLGYTILPVTLIFFNFDYWFEMISLTVIFELLMFIDIYKNDVAEG